jgi:subtilisin family serine protease
MFVHSCTARTQVWTLLHGQARSSPSAPAGRAADDEVFMLRAPRLRLRSLLLPSLLLTATAAAETATAPSLAQRFAPRWYAAQGQPVVVQAALDRLALRTQAPLPVDAVARLVETSLLQALAADLAAGREVPVLVDAARLLRRDGLYELVLDRPLTPARRLRLAEALAAQPAVLQVYPVPSRLGYRIYTDDHLILSAAPGQLDAVLARVLPKIDGQLARRSRVPDTALVRVGAAFAHDAIEASRALTLAGLPGLRSAEPDPYRQLAPTATVNDPMFGQQWHLAHTDSGVPGDGEIHVSGAWGVTKGDPQVVIAVFDTGVDLAQEDLVPNFVPGFDAADGDEDPSAECSASYDGNGEAASCPSDAPYRESHSTSVCGTAAGRGDNGQGTSGVCPQCRVMPVRLLGATDMLSGLSTAEAFVRAVDDGAAVINNSWGIGFSRYFPLSQAEVDALARARYQGRGGLGAVVVFASGNDTADVAGDPYARDVHVLAVSGSTNLDDWAYYSNYGAEIDVVAPTSGGATTEDSYGIVTTDVTGGEGYASGGYATDFGGTSASSPVVAGLAGLLLSANPGLTADQVRVILTSTADKIRADRVDWEAIFGQDIEALFEYDALGHSIGFGWGRVNAGAAVQAALRPSLQGALCSAPGCPVCGPDDRCRLQCKYQGDCPDGTICEGAVCAPAAPRPTDIGEPCVDACAYCVPALDIEFAPAQLCTALCSVDDDCPSGWDCRRLGDDGPRVCAVGSPAAGEPPVSRFDCLNDMVGAGVVVLGSDGERYCSDLCFDDQAGACPYGFHCGYATCTCTTSFGGGWCIEYECTEVPTERASDWYFPQCFPDEDFGVVCASDEDCKLGDYCLPDGSCRRDDRAGCAQVCAACVEDVDCGPRGRCYDREDGLGTRCLIACDADGACPGDSVCREIAMRRGTAKYCLGPADSTDVGCDDSYTCQVPCRDDVPCADGLVCDAGSCVQPPAPPPPAGDDDDDDDDDGSGCGCRSGSGAVPSLALLALGVLGIRRRR